MIFTGTIIKGWRAASVMRIIALVALLLGGLCLVSDFGRPLEETLRDSRDAIRNHPASGEIHIVEIDAKSLAKIDRWPWPRAYHAQIVDRLNAAGAHIIAFDVDFSAHSDLANDTRFAEALKRANGGVILPTFQQLGSNRGSTFVENLPIAPLREHAFLASVNIHPDRGGLVRQYSTGVVTAKTMRPAIGAMLAESSSLAAVNFTIDQSIDPATIPRHSFVDVMNGTVPASVLAGKRIVIGATAIELGDRYAVPRHSVLPGVVIQAMAGETLLQGSAMANFGAVPLLLFAGVILWLRIRSTARLSHLIFLGMGMVVAMPLGLESLRIGSLDAAPALVALVSGGLMIAAFNIACTFRRNRLTESETGLPNALAFAEFNPQSKGHVIIAARVARYGEIATVVGAEGAVDLIRRIAERLAYAADNGRVYRCDSDALAWSVPRDEADALPDRIAALDALFRAPVRIGARAIDVSLTFGIVADVAVDTQQSIAKALLAADRAASQGLQWDRHDEAIDDAVDWKLSLLSELDEALADGQIWVAYQPKADITNGQIVGAEALIRWNHPTRGAIAPDHFIPTIEQAGRMGDLTVHVLRQAVADLEGWRDQGHDVSVAVNLSASLLDDAGFVAIVEAQIAHARFAPSALTFEITESAAMAHPDQAIQVMTELRKLGVCLSIDDYGTGQSTLTYLKRLPATEIKIDKSFIQDIVDSRSDQILVRSTIALAHDLGFKVVAEGVETLECLNQLRALGCDTAQGWLTGRPITNEAFVALLGEPLKRAA